MTTLQPPVAAEPRPAPPPAKRDRRSWTGWGFLGPFVAVFALLPRRVLRREAALPPHGSRRFRDPIVGAVSGILVLLVVWAALSRPTPTDTTASRQLALAGQAHGKDVVTVILADFRGLDTMVEITVLVVALLGVAALLRRGRLW